MLVLWMGYALLVGLGVAGTAALFERATRGRRRFLWAGAQLLLVALPLLRPLLRALGSSGRPLDVALGPIGPAVRGALPSLDVIGASAASSTTLADLQGPLLGAWIGASLVLLALVVGGVLRVRRLRRSWRVETVDGVEVLVSESLGPAVIGMLRPSIVLPAWVLDLDRKERALILAHEEEHRSAGDPRLLAASLAVPVLMPWNPAAWWTFLKLRDAVEIDCDARVLRHAGGKPVRYARLLFAVSTRTADSVPVGAGFGERTPSLERRIRTLVRGTIGFGPRGFALRAALAVLVLGTACSLEISVDLSGRESAESAAAVPVPDADAGPPVGTRQIERPATPLVPDGSVSVKDGPTFTPFTVAPTILNREEVVGALEASYPPLLRDAGIGGTVTVYFYIDENGIVQDRLLDKSSGHQALDEAALNVAKMYRFAPALNRDQKVPVWVSFPITFQVRN